MWPKEWFKFDSQPLKHKKSNDFKIKHVIILKFIQGLQFFSFGVFQLKLVCGSYELVKLQDSHFRIFFCFDVTITNNHKIYYRENIDACSQMSKPCE